MNKKDMAVIDEAVSLLEKKGEDYNSTVKREDYFPHGLLSYHQMLHVKVTRLQSLIQSGEDANFESIKDTLQDLLNYTVMTLSYLEPDDGRSTTRDTSS